MSKQNYDTGKTFLAGAGRWATERLKAAALEGKAFSAAALRTLDTLRKEEWEHFDNALVEEGKIRLVGVADLISRGLVIPVSNALGKTMFSYEKMTDMGAATTSLDGLARSDNDRLEFELSQLPLPITHKDFFINLRQLASSRAGGESLDTTHVRVAGRVVAEQLENMLFNGGKTFGGAPIYGYTTHPNRNTSGFGSNGDWGQLNKTGENILTDVQTMLTALKADRFYGPYVIYVPGDADVKLSGDFKANSDKTIRQRLLEVEGIADIRTADQLATSNVVMAQMTQDVVAWVQGEDLQTIQWDEYGGFQVNFKAFAIGVPLVRADIQNRSGVYHMTD
jgi:uncharacterized linocin/CFP29 family protein